MLNIFTRILFAGLLISLSTGKLQAAPGKILVSNSVATTMNCALVACPRTLAGATLGGFASDTLIFLTGLVTTPAWSGSSTPVSLKVSIVLQGGIFAQNVATDVAVRGQVQAVSTSYELFLRKGSVVRINAVGSAVGPLLSFNDPTVRLTYRVMTVN